MTAVGEPLPDADLWILHEGRPRKVTSREVLGEGRVVLFAVPGAFTPGCSRVHLPGYVQHAEELSDRGVDTVACVSVNDPWVMDAWARAHGAEEKVLMLSDGNADLTRKLGMELDGSASGMGPVRSKRYAAVLQDGVVEHLDVDEHGGIDVSACEAVLAKL